MPLSWIGATPADWLQSGCGAEPAHCAVPDWRVLPAFRIHSRRSVWIGLVSPHRIGAGCPPPSWLDRCRPFRIRPTLTMAGMLQPVWSGLPYTIECTRPRTASARTHRARSPTRMFPPNSNKAFGRLAAGILLVALAPMIAAQDGWIGESPHFRVVAQARPGLDVAAVASAVEDLEWIRERYLGDGLGSPRRADGPLDVLLVGTLFDLHALLRYPPNSRTRGITIGGMDRELVVVPWHALPGPRVTLAHEYAHQLDENVWPVWFREGRAVFLARRMPSRSGEDPVAGLLAILDRSEWVAWPDLLAAGRDSDVADEEIFQAQAWSLVHWLASTQASVARLRPDDASDALDRLGADALSIAIREHLANLPTYASNEVDPDDSSADEVTVREASAWIVPLFEAEVLRELRFLDEAERRLAALAANWPSAARVQAAYAAVLLLRRREDEAERRFRMALELGDARPRTAYRYALLLMRPGEPFAKRARDALRYALYAVRAMPWEPNHHLALAQAQMLAEDWGSAYRALRDLAGFPGWGRVAGREVAEIERRRFQELRPEPPPALEPAIPLNSVSVPLSIQLRPWEEPAVRARPPAGRRRWPPYGTWLVHGKVAWVDCSAQPKRVIVHTPYKRLILLIDERRPLRLINRPFRGNSLPCEARGWNAAFAYRKIPDGRDADGELVGIRF